MLIRYRYSKKFKQKLINNLCSYSKYYKLAKRWHWYNKYYLRHIYVVKKAYTYIISVSNIIDIFYEISSNHSNGSIFRVGTKTFWKFAKKPAYKKVWHLYKPESHFADDSKITNYYTTCTTTKVAVKDNKFHMFNHKNKTYEITDLLGDGDTIVNNNGAGSTATFNVTSEVASVSFEDQISHLKEDMAFDVDNPKYQRIEKLVDNFEKQRYNLNSLKEKSD